MFVDLPLLKRCCFCLPLRCGLIVWGYLKLIISGLQLTATYFSWLHIIELMQSYRNFSTGEIVMLCLLTLSILILVIDLILNTLFVIGCHQKDTNLMRGFYYYGYFMLGMIVVGELVYFGFTIYMLCNISSMFWISIIWGNSVFAVGMVIQFYVQLLVRSEIVILNNGYKFSFVNNAAMAECTLDIDNVIGEKARIIEEEYKTNATAAVITEEPKIVAGILLLSMSLSLHQMIYVYMKYKSSLHYIIMITVVMSVLIVDIVLHTIFVVGAHKKNVRLLRVFYFYSMVIWVLTALLGLAAAGLILCTLNFNLGSFLLILLISDMATLFANLLAQTYILLLVRSEIVKLSNGTRFEFVNNAAEAECILKFANPDVTGTEYEYEYEEREKEEPRDVIYVCPGPLDGNTCCKEALKDEIEV
ncbi:uncharacterized protein LOC142977372 [Anticarsia gemmatalis]|uniref:uncharacterized protein LOC142977372 n=1 Tax=Anticarsia gemmatalis TaxID=129554 RepID=UPI003F76A5D6